MAAENKVEFKFTIGDVKSGKSYSRLDLENPLIGKKIGDTIQGSLLGLTGYELKITGGSDRSGFPMLQSIEGTLRKKVILRKGMTGIKKIKKGVIKRKTVVGNTINQSTAQVNLKITKYGTKPIEDILGIKQKEEQTEQKHAS